MIGSFYDLNPKFNLEFGIWISLVPAVPPSRGEEYGWIQPVFEAMDNNASKPGIGCQQGEFSRRMKAGCTFWPSQFRKFANKSRWFCWWFEYVLECYQIFSARFRLWGQLLIALLKTHMSLIEHRFIFVRKKWYELFRRTCGVSFVLK